MTSSPKPEPKEADKELDKILRKALDIRADMSSRTFEEAHFALLAWRDKAVVAARRDEIEKFPYDKFWNNIKMYKDERIAQLKAIMEIKE